MRVLVDTSVWGDFFNGFPSPQARVLARLIEREEEIVTCGAVMAEVLQGIRKQRDRAEIEGYFREMEYLATEEPGTWLAAAVLQRKLREKGVTVRSLVDCLVARLAEAAGVTLLAKDRDMTAILASKLCDLEAVAIEDAEQA